MDQAKYSRSTGDAKTSAFGVIPKSCDTLMAQATAYRSTWLLFLPFFQ